MDEKDILGGLGRSTAEFAAVLGMDYTQAAVFSAKTALATGVGAKDMKHFLDLLQRTKNAGVNVDDLGYAFARLSGTLHTMGIQGLEKSKEMTVLVAGLSRMGVSGERIGTNMTALFDQLSNSKKVGEMNAELAQFGIHLDIFDKAGRFAGVPKMMDELTELQALNPKQFYHVSS